MISQPEEAPSARLTGLYFLEDSSALVVHFEDGRQLLLPLVWYPKLLRATPEQRSNWRLLGHGTGVHWPDVDEDLSVAGMLRGVRAAPERRASTWHHDVRPSPGATAIIQSMTEAWVRLYRRDFASADSGNAFPVDEFRAFAASEIIERLVAAKHDHEAGEPEIIIHLAEVEAHSLWGKR
jgi:hypothetical protein